MVPARRAGSVICRSVFGVLKVWWFLDSVFLDPVYKGLAADIEITGRVGLIPIALVKGLQEELFFDCFQTDALRRQLYLEGIDTGFLLPQEWR